MPQLAELSSKDQVTVPAEVRKTLQLKTGDTLAWEIQDDGNKDSSGCVVPNHHELKVGTLSGILRQAGVSQDEFIKALRA